MKTTEVKHKYEIGDKVWYWVSGLHKCHECNKTKLIKFEIKSGTVVDIVVDIDVSILGKKSNRCIVRYGVSSPLNILEEYRLYSKEEEAQAALKEER